MVIAIPRPELPPGFDTDRIALFIGPEKRLDYYAGAKWSARLDELLQDYIVRTARAELPGRVFDTGDVGANARARLNVRVTEMQPVYAREADKPPELRVALTMTVVALPGNTVRAHVNAAKSAVASENRLSAVTTELEALLQAATRDALQRVAPALRGEADSFKAGTILARVSRCLIRPESRSSAFPSPSP
jgi:ABC-type uncharacterized transport system auxiliary subunit